ncbi:MAG: hypothetical protein IJ705_06195 [Oscillospiraceae bacterium]|nr:hypothetical protein [Oscillospiraceae bacterium]
MAIGGGRRMAFTVRSIATTITHPGADPAHGDPAEKPGALRAKALPAGQKLPERTELVFSAPPAAGAEPAEAGEAGAAWSPENSTYLRSLPDWARSLLEKPDADAAAGQRKALSRNTAVPGASAGGGTPGQITWTAPGMPAIVPRSPDETNRPADISFREPERAERQQPPRKSGMSDAEIRRAADKIYGIIEERLRRELRRSGR